MLRAKFQDLRSFPSGEEDFLNVLAIDLIGRVFS